MITVLIHFKGAEAKIKAASENEDSKVKFAYFKETRMNNVYQLFIKSREDFVIIRKKIKKLSSVTIICGWNDKGKKIKFPNSEDDFTRAKFKQRLKKRITRDENGEVTEDREYNDEEINEGVINVIYGHPKREY